MKGEEIYRKEIYRKDDAQTEGANNLNLLISYCWAQGYVLIKNYNLIQWEKWNNLTFEQNHNSDNYLTEAIWL